ncbi:hypothetical protein BGX38DRAFT_912778 [Terfezia claveryi]|nr:hypothetical protein BGX38DRAFT_912778 [Terfezia claveryi]
MFFLSMPPSIPQLTALHHQTISLSILVESWHCCCPLPVMPTFLKKIFLFSNKILYPSFVT